MERGPHRLCEAFPWCPLNTNGFGEKGGFDPGHPSAPDLEMRSSRSPRSPAEPPAQPGPAPTGANLETTGKMREKNHFQVPLSSRKDEKKGTSVKEKNPLNHGGSSPSSSHPHLWCQDL